MQPSCSAVLCDDFETVPMVSCLSLNDGEVQKSRMQNNSNVSPRDILMKQPQ
jgi:hypothetical protein